jgi:hypothetical protein
MADVVDGFRLVAAGVLDGSSREAHLAREADGERRIFRRVAEAALEIGRYRQRCRFDDRAGVGQSLFARHVAVAAAQRIRTGATRGGERLEAQAFEYSSGPRIPHVRDHERCRPRVQRAEASGLVLQFRAHANLTSRLEVMASA